MLIFVVLSLIFTHACFSFLVSLCFNLPLCVFCVGVGESAPSAHFYQNVGEAEYVVATYMYMRLLGYPASKISILTTYNGQKHLIRDVLRARCSPFPSIFGMPSIVTTVDRFQGQQNDYVLLSLVKTRNIGHIRDVRRLVVSLSRARLGLYIFGRAAIFANCYDLTPAFNQLLQTPVQLQLVLGETYNADGGEVSDRSVVGKSPAKYNITDVGHLGALVHNMLQHRTGQQ